ncbi:MAG TPA: HD domain-containing phosphohydrolase, partial [Chthonomonadaceae bacterium]|nr:HD domain-containing phosphohydrolase [Chthonomonadaceae bacterium]
MLFVTSSQVTEGMCVAEDVVDHGGRMLISRGQRIGPEHLKRLHKFGIQSLFIDQNRGEKPKPVGKSSLRKQCESVLNTICCRFTSGGSPPPPDPGEIRAAADALVTSLVKAGKSIVSLSGSAEDEQLTHHSINVAALAVALAIDLRLPRQMLMEIGSAMLLHDVGFMLLPHELYHRTEPPSRSEARQLKAHTVLGYDFVLKTGA